MISSSNHMQGIMYQQLLTVFTRNKNKVSINMKGAVLEMV